VPAGQITALAVQSTLQKYSASQFAGNTFMDFRRPAQAEGRFAIVTDVGQGCGGRGSVLRARCGAQHQMTPRATSAVTPVLDAFNRQKPDNRHFRDYPLTGHDADTPKSTRMTHLGHSN